MVEVRRGSGGSSLSGHFADRLVEAIRDKSAPVCVGLDPLLERLPLPVRSEAGLPRGERTSGETSEADEGAVRDALRTFGRGVIEAVAAHVPAVKINIAFFERYHTAGVAVYFELVRFAQEKGLLVIGDVKRADIGHSARQYALGQLAAYRTGAASTPDAITINPYFGSDGVEPFLEVAQHDGRGVFVLVQTSNPSAGQVQGVRVEGGEPLVLHVARLVREWACRPGMVGHCGFSAVGAVVAPQDRETTAAIRREMPECIFLVPGFGAQGRGGEDVRVCFTSEGTGAIVSASRSVIYAFDDDRYRKACGDDWRACIEQACRDFVTSVREALCAR
ncbi:MAG: orotidine-5'-phosphate decarboxylase [Planctomycetota bacterium]|nr:MAG: orotidine-5'-phosphate decarboxylase [Planctomycetota bacterium]